MPIEGFDYSWGRPGAASLVAAGGRFVVRYLTFPGDNGKGLLKPELSELRRAGLDVAVVFQNGKTQTLGGQDAGVRDARLAESALADLGMAGWPVYFAVDFDATAAQLDVAEQYLRGAASVLGLRRTGVYGGWPTIDRCYRNRTAAWFWQTFAWSGGKLHTAAHMYQYAGDTINGAAVDRNRAYPAEYGQHPVTAAPAAPNWWAGLMHWSNA